jgi:hypothetical protein
VKSIKFFDYRLCLGSFSISLRLELFATILIDDGIDFLEEMGSALSCLSFYVNFCFKS